MTTKPTKTATGEQKFTSTLEWLLAQIEAYLKKNPHLTPAGFGWVAIRDTSVVERLRQGKDVTTRKFDALVRYMSNPNQKKEISDGKQSKTKGKKVG